MSTTFPARRLGSAGIITDVHPADVESLAAFTGGVNCRFQNGRVSRAPVFRTIADLPHPPAHLLAIPPSSSGYEEVIAVSSDYGNISRLNGEVFEDLTPPAHTGGASTACVTSGVLGGVTYVNRSTHAPLCKQPADDTFVTLPNWPIDDRCKVLRPYKDQLIALGVTKQGSFYPTMVRWSDFAYYGAAPTSWDPTDPERSAGENIINEMTQEIIDGQSLRDSFVLYCASSVWLMDYTGGQEIYQFRKVLGDRGVINPNCIVQVSGLHYVFDRDDIYVFDGVSDRTICDKRVKRFIFGALNFKHAHRCFAYHDAKLNEVRFCYVSGDEYTNFPETTSGCNRQAVYNYAEDTWTFYDVPNIVGHCKAALLAGENWNDNEDAQWEDVGGIWMSTDEDMDRHVLVASHEDPAGGLTASRIYGQDLINGGRLFRQIHPETLKPAKVERLHIDLDLYSKRLTQHVNVQAIWPQINMDSWSDCYWQFGGTNFLAVAPEWGPLHTFDPTTETKIDLNESGKYWSYKFICGGEGDFELSSFDVQYLIRGRR